MPLLICTEFPGNFDPPKRSCVPRFCNRSIIVNTLPPGEMSFASGGKSENHVPSRIEAELGRVGINGGEREGRVKEADAFGESPNLFCRRGKASGTTIHSCCRSGAETSWRKVRHICIYLLHAECCFLTNKRQRLAALLSMAVVLACGKWTHISRAFRLRRGFYFSQPSRAPTLHLQQAHLGPLVDVIHHLLHLADLLARVHASLGDSRSYSFVVGRERKTVGYSSQIGFGECASLRQKTVQ